MTAIIGNIETIIMMYAPVVGTYLIQIIQWLIMWKKMKNTTKIQEDIQKIQQDKIESIEEVIELNKELSKENFILRDKLNKVITLLQHYEEKDQCTK